MKGQQNYKNKKQNKSCCCLFAAGKTTTKVNTSVVGLLFVVIGLCCRLSVESFAGVSQNQWELRYQSQLKTVTVKSTTQLS